LGKYPQKAAVSLKGDRKDSFICNSSVLLYKLCAQFIPTDTYLLMQTTPWKVLKIMQAFFSLDWEGTFCHVETNSIAKTSKGKAKIC